MSKKTPKFTMKGERREALCEKVYDGDTAHFVYKMCEHCPARRFSCRLYGCNTAELRTKDEEEKKKALAAKAFLSAKILDKKVNLEFFGADKYGRELVVITSMETGENINEAIIAGGFGSKYFGKGEKNY